MSIVLVGLNHHTAPVELREQLSLSGCALTMALEDLRKTVNEAVILSTCNRLEIYAVTQDAGEGWANILNFITGLQNIPPETLRPHLYFLQNEDAVHHLMRVAAGLDSMILGESQILGQVSQAFMTAQASGTTGAVLSQLFTKAAHVGKRARSETDINRYTTSVSHAAALLADGKSGGLKNRNVLIIGAGEMAELAAHAFEKRGAPQMTFINRTYSRAETLAHHFAGRALGWHDLHGALVWADVVVSATGAPHIVLRTADIEKTLPERRHRPLLLIDIAVPRDIEEMTLPDVQRFDIDDLRSIVDVNMAQRKAAIPQAEAIIEHEQRAFSEWLHSRDVMPVIENLRRRAEEIAHAEVQQALNRLHAADDPHTEQVISRMAHRLVNKLLHEPTVRLKSFAAEGDGVEYAQALCDLFALDVESNNS